MILVNIKNALKDTSNVDLSNNLFALKIRNAQYLRLDIKMKTNKQIMNT